MSSRINPTELVGAQVRDVMTALLDNAVDQLKSSRGGVHKAVHGARKNLKAFRAYLRMLRAIIGEEQFRRLNAGARDAARILAGARDTAALHDAIGIVEKHLKRSRHTLDVTALRRAADAEASASTSETAIRLASRTVMNLLAPCREEVRAWQLPDQPSDYIAGLITAYGKARKTLRHSLATRLPDDLHEARKRVIHWRYQLDLFGGLWQRVIKAEVRELQELRTDLGQHNDLVLLESRIRCSEGGFADLADAEQFLDAITLLRSDRARTTAYRQDLLFVDPPSRRTEMLTHWWQTALERKATIKN